MTKGACLTYIPLGTAVVVGLPETGVETLLGLPTKFWGLLMSATVAGAGGLLAFLSTSFSGYRQQMKADATGETQTTTTEPAPTIAEKKEQDKP